MILTAFTILAILLQIFSVSASPVSIQVGSLNLAQTDSTFRSKGVEVILKANRVSVKKYAYFDIFPVGNSIVDVREADLEFFSECRFSQRIAIRNGSWNDPNSWFMKSVPSAETSVCIPKGIAVDLSSSGAMNAKALNIFGLIRSSNSGNVDLFVSNSVMVNSGGRLEISLSSGLSNVNLQARYFIVENADFSVSNMARGKITLQAQAISIRNKAKFIVNAPYTFSKVDILFNGIQDVTDASFSISERNIGVNFLAATDLSLISINGAPVRKTWLKLRKSAMIGDKEIFLNVPVPESWKVGDYIVISATGFNPDESEFALISYIQGNRIVLEDGLKYSHYGLTQNFSASWNLNLILDERAEVALLSRNIRITPANNVPKETGVQVFATSGSTLQVLYAEIFRGGHTAKLMRYSIHMHLLSSTTPKQIIKGCSIWKSNNRCIVLHRTQDTAIEDNLCFDTVGHAVFLENGVETGNTFSRNLIMLTRPSNLHPFDNQPSSFWITNQNNSFFDNVASGSFDTGFWWLGLTKPLNADANLPYQPKFAPFGAFERNEAHTVRMAFRFDEDVDSKNDFIPGGIEPIDARTNTYQTIEMKDILAHHVTDQAFWVRLGSRNNGWNCISCIVADTGIGYRLVSNYLLYNNLIVGRSENTGCDKEITWDVIGSVMKSRRCSPSSGLDEYVGFFFYDGPVFLDGIHFAKFCGSTCQTRSFGIGDSVALVKSTTQRARRISFDSEISRKSAFFFFSTAYASWWSSSIIDLDGSLSGYAGYTVIPKISTAFEKPGDKNYILQTGPPIPAPYTAIDFPFVWDSGYNLDPSNICFPVSENALACPSRRGLLKFTENPNNLVWSNYTRSDGYKMTAVFGFFSQTSVWISRSFAYGVELWGKMPEYGVILSDVKPKEFVYFRFRNLIQPVNVIFRKPDNSWDFIPVVQNAFDLENAASTAFLWESPTSLLVKIVAEQYSWVKRLGNWRSTYEFNGIADVCVVKDLKNIGIICEQPF